MEKTLNKQIREAWKLLKVELEEQKLDPVVVVRRYHELVWPLLLEKWRSDPPLRLANEFERPEVSIHTLGTSPEATALAAIALGADRVFILHTEETKQYLPFVEDALGAARLMPRKVDKSDPVTIYKAGRDVIEQTGAESVAIDITSGTKAMTAGLAAFGFFVQAEMDRYRVRVYYVNNDRYDPILRRPEPGSEFLVELPSPIVAYGEVRRAKAAEHFRSENFSRAERLFRELHRDTRKGPYQSFAELAHVYYRWYALDFREAERTLDKLVSFLKKPEAHEDPLRERVEELSDQLEGLRKIITFLERCEKKASEPCLSAMAEVASVAWLVETLFHIAHREHVRGRHTLASLGFYRVLELLAQHKLARRGVHPHAFNPEPLGEETVVAMRTLLEEAVGGEPRMPGTGQGLSLLSMLVLLLALGEPVFQTMEDHLRGAYGYVQARNDSLLIHGFKTPTKKEADKLRDLVEQVLRAFRNEQETPTGVSVSPLDLPLP